MALNSGRLSGGAKVCLLFDNKHQLLSLDDDPQVLCTGGTTEKETGRSSQIQGDFHTVSQPHFSHTSTATTSSATTAIPH